MIREFFDDYKSYSPANTQQEIYFIMQVLNLPAAARILDLYCGYGRHAIQLAKNGFRVTGVDPTQAFLDIARQKAREEMAELEFQQYDMRCLDFHQKFDAVINMFATFGYFSDEENLNVLKLIAQSLQSKGVLLMDLLNRDWMVRNNLNRYWRHPGGDYVVSYKVELQNGVAVMKREITNQNTGVKTKYEFFLRSYSLPELDLIMQASGFHIVNAYGNFDNEPYSPDSPRMIVLAEKTV
ncbi:class I SAM-dependent methyltransferase [Acetonema longum]|uniref:Methyltransferase type 11 n=1 Tax=Acetonema longum DSM 6540 TaxID=1009370 RepID=F7NJN5_9FIRM|nr:class I SAM-dependent methyltransferase [Acetonema longum]EGO63739.1 Methyltransferase type 11 [Acetonema longum DSM 6540]